MHVKATLLFGKEKSLVEKGAGAYHKDKKLIHKNKILTVILGTSSEIRTNIRVYVVR